MGAHHNAHACRSGRAAAKPAPADSSVREVPTVGSIAQCSATEAALEVAEAEVVLEVAEVTSEVAEVR